MVDLVDIMKMAQIVEDCLLRLPLHTDFEKELVAYTLWRSRVLVNDINTKTRIAEEVFKIQNK